MQGLRGGERRGGSEGGGGRRCEASREGAEGSAEGFREACRRPLGHERGKDVVGRGEWVRGELQSFAVRACESQNLRRDLVGHDSFPLAPRALTSSHSHNRPCSFVLLLSCSFTTPLIRCQHRLAPAWHWAAFHSR